MMKSCLTYSNKHIFLCQIGELRQPSIDFLSYIFNEQGIAMNDSKLKGVIESL